MAVSNFKELDVWKLSIDLAEAAFLATKSFPKDELYGMTSQIRRAAVSVPANIAEGQGRHHTKEFVHFLGVARGSLMELQTHLILAKRVQLLDDLQFQALIELCERVSQMISRLVQALERKM